MKRYSICFRRPKDIAEFVRTISQFDCDMDIQCGRQIVDAKSILGVLAISKASQIELVIHSEDCDEIVDSVRDYIELQKSA